MGFSRKTARGTHTRNRRGHRGIGSRGVAAGKSHWPPASWRTRETAGVTSEPNARGVAAGVSVQVWGPGAPRWRAGEDGVSARSEGVGPSAFSSQGAGWCLPRWVRMILTPSADADVISSRDVTPDAPRSDVLPSPWASLSPVAWTQEIHPTLAPGPSAERWPAAGLNVAATAPLVDVPPPRQVEGLGWS